MKKIFREPAAKASLLAIGLVLAVLILSAGCSGEPAAAPAQPEDASYLYQNGADLQVTLAGQAARVQRWDGKVLLAAAGGWYRDLSGGALRTNAELRPARGGFDVVYTVANPTDERQPLPNLEIPGVGLTANGGLDLLNPYKLYAEHRRLVDEIGHDDYLIPAAGFFHYTNGNGQTVHYESDPSYGGQTNGAYAPVIVAADGDFAVGAALEYPFVDYRDPDAPTLGKRHIPRDRLYPRSRVYRDADSWRYVFTFANNDDPGRGGHIPPGQTWTFTVTLRFAPARYWLLTLYPYKQYLARLYPQRYAPTRDVSPVFWLALAYPGNTNAQNPRGWSWYYNKGDAEGHRYLPVDEITRALAELLPERGYRRILIHSLSGTYDVPRDHFMFDEIPYQYASNFEAAMADQVPGALARLRNAGLEYYFWWGIAGMIPLDSAGAVLDLHTWLPARDKPFDLNNPEEHAYALAHLQDGLDLHAAGLSLDAYVRMEPAGALAWLDEIRERAPNLRLAAELQQDVYHTRAAIIVQHYSKDSDLDRNRISSPPVLAQYLNPEAEVEALLSRYGDLGDVAAHMRQLARMGYTPLVRPLPFSGHYIDQNDVYQRILEQNDKFFDVRGIDNGIIYSCFNGRDDDGDGLTDWPYDLDCPDAASDGE